MFINGRILPNDEYGFRFEVSLFLEIEVGSMNVSMGRVRDYQNQIANAVFRISIDMSGRIM